MDHFLTWLLAFAFLGMWLFSIYHRDERDFERLRRQALDRQIGDLYRHIARSNEEMQRLRARLEVAEKAAGQKITTGYGSSGDPIIKMGESSS